MHYLLILTVFLMFGCSKEEDYANATIKIAPIYHAYPQDLNWSSSETKEVEKALALPEYTEEGCLIDNNVFSFLVIVPLSTKDDIEKRFKLYEGGDHVAIIMNKCGSNDRMYLVSSLIRKSTNWEVNGTYNYFAFDYASELKARGYFDHITDLCLKIHESEDTMEKKYLYSSNTVVIPAQEIKDMLDGLGIPYE